MFFKSAAETVSPMLYPENIKCLCCGDELSFETAESICPKCALPKNDEYCLRCGRRIENMAHYCDVCMKRKWSFDLARSAFIFQDAARKLVYSLKFGKEGYLAKYIAPYLFRTYLSSDFVADAVTFVPIHKSRKRARGFNQAELIAAEFCRLADLPLLHILEKPVKTKPLSKLKAAERVEAIKGTITLSRAITESDGGKVPLVSGLNGKNIILIDDVFTSGATANECSRVIKTAKSGDVMVLTFASVAMKPNLY